MDMLTVYPKNSTEPVYIKEGFIIYVGAYIFRFKNGEVWLQKITPMGGIGWVDFEAGLLKIILENVDTFTFQSE